MVANWITRLLNKTGISGFSVKDNVNRKVIYLTLDDGPNHKTQDLLNWMESQNILATHFWVGERIRKAEIDFQNLHGQQFAVHGFSHKKYSKLSFNEIDFELAQLKQLGLENLNGYQSWFRPPYGSWKPGLGKKLKKEGYTILFWSFLFTDWLESFEPNVIQKRKNEWLKKGSILVFHDKPEFHDRIKESLILVKEICNQNDFELSCLPLPK